MYLTIFSWIYLPKIVYIIIDGIFIPILAKILLVIVPLFIKFLVLGGYGYGVLLK